MIVHPWWLQVLAIGWVLVRAAASGQDATMRTTGDQSPDLAAVVARVRTLGRWRGDDWNPSLKTCPSGGVGDLWLHAKATVRQWALNGDHLWLREASR